MRTMADKLGICQWFHYQDYQAVESSVALLKELGVRHLRTGVSWADYHRPGGKAWYEWQMAQLEDFEVLLSVWHTPPSISEGGTCASPPRRLEAFGEFIGQLVDEFGNYISWFELWNEPNNRLKWAFDEFDPLWEKFGTMIRRAAQVARRKAKPTVLGGIIPVDHSWLELMKGYGVLDAVDAVAIHAFPNMWWTDQPNWDWHRDWNGWEAKIDYISPYSPKKLWITETGLATWSFDTNAVGRMQMQCAMLLAAAAAPVERVYWYSLIDLAPHRDAIEGFHVDENEYHLGIVDCDLNPKPAFDVFRDLLSRKRSRPLA